MRLLVVLGAVAVAFAALGPWRRAPRVSRVEPRTIGATGPAIVQFSTPGRGACRRARPILEQAARDSGLQFVDVDLTLRPDLAGRYGIRSVPFVLVAGVDGEVLGRWTGVPPDEEIRRLAAMAGAA